MLRADTMETNPPGRTSDTRVWPSTGERHRALKDAVQALPAGLRASARDSERCHAAAGG
ncbi:MAG: hypothetical protein QOH46_1540, partial [Solirubrobacteraceae bacterium]|nr:hypothetical protein [Solirubrobacteraceae bacterium]